MALNGSTMGDEVATAVKAVYDSISKTTPITDDNIEDIWTAMANSIVAHIQANAVVNVNVTVTSGSSAGTYPGVGTVS